MSKTLITVLGLVLSLGVVALGFFVIALPIFVQSLTVDAQTATVANTNAIYQAQVDSLTAQEENLSNINESVAALGRQIPSTGQFDDVFEVIARAAETSHVILTNVTAGDESLFEARTGATDDESTSATAPAPAPTPAPTDGANDTQSTDTDRPASGRQQVEFSIVATADDMGQVTAFLDALRAGPRLLNSVSATSTQASEGTISVNVKALTYIDAKG